jgi:phosphopantothenoylcysteine decarboxylase/phosphopantothenate--cysteine ligase
MGHIELAKWADLVLIAPATADLIARLAQGIADDLLTTLVLATDAVVAVAPAMNQAMWRDPATQANLQLLESRGLKSSARPPAARPAATSAWAACSKPPIWRSAPPTASSARR